MSHNTTSYLHVHVLFYLVRVFSLDYYATCLLCGGCLSHPLLFVFLIGGGGGGGGSSSSSSSLNNPLLVLAFLLLLLAFLLGGGSSSSLGNPPLLQFATIK